LLAEDWDSGWDLGTGGRPPYEHIIDSTEIPFEFGLFVDRDFSKKWNGEPIDLSEDSEFTNLYVQIEHGVPAHDELGNHLLHITECITAIYKYNGATLEYEKFDEFLFLENGCPMKDTSHIIKMKEQRTEWTSDNPMFNRDQFVFYPSFFPDGSYQISYTCKYALCPAEAFKIESSPVGQVCRLSQDENKKEFCDKRYDNLLTSRSSVQEYDRSDEYRKKIDANFWKGAQTSPPSQCKDEILKDSDFELAIKVMMRSRETGEIFDWDGVMQRPESGNDFIVEISNPFEPESELKYNVLHLDECTTSSYYYDRLNPVEPNQNDYDYNHKMIDINQAFVKDGCIFNEKPEFSGSAVPFFEMNAKRDSYTSNELMLKKDQFILPNLFLFGFGDGSINVTINCEVRLCTSDSFNGISACKLRSNEECNTRYDSITTETERCPYRISKVKSVSAFMLMDGASSLALTLPLIILLLL